MAGFNPFQAIMGRMMPQAPQMPQMPVQNSQMNNQSQPDWNVLMGQLQSNTAGAIKEAHYDVPEEIVNNPQAAAMHIIQSGQANNNPMMRFIMPMLNQMGIKL